MTHTIPSSIAIIGGGPAGLMASEQCAQAGMAVTVYDRMPSALRTWCENLGEETFIGSSGRIFPKAFKASPLLRAWLQRLTALGVTFKLRHEWKGFDDDHLLFEDADKKILRIKPAATLLALGGASWPRLGADGSWINYLKNKNIAIIPLRPANCGFAVGWSEHLSSRFAGQPLKTIAVSLGDKLAQGEIMITAQGIEGGAIYALSAPLRDAIAEHGNATLHIDLRKDIAIEELTKRLNMGRGSQSLSTYLKKNAGLSPLSIALIQEASRLYQRPIETATQLAKLIKALSVTVTAPMGIDRAISTAGGIALDEINADFMLKKLPGVFVAGEMLDWEAPTGGYLLQACFSTAVAAAKGMIAHTK
ncbi:MAG: TIGR03862 family flavoprotein [Alphaproteobacteria bacterium]|nr:TIGR03862 family flavoprotein [Alphaproteobacteria bacterium]